VQPLLQWKSNEYYIFWVCVCSLGYPACNAQIPYCHLWPVQHSSIFPHYLINGTIFLKKMVLYIKCVFWFYLQFMSATFLILCRTKWDLLKNVHWSSYTLPVFLSDFNETLVLDSFSKNTQISNIMHICPVGAEFFCMDRQDGQPWQS